MQPYVLASDLYRFKLALVLGRGKRLKKIMRKYPTEEKFKQAEANELTALIKAEKQPHIIEQLFSLDELYDELVTFKANPFWSKKPKAKKIMAVDTEYYKSKLDLIQFVVLDNQEVVDSGVIFTNEDIAPSVDPKIGIKYLRDIINEHKPDLLVGHNFNSDVSILETAAARRLPELYFYDDTMDLMYYSNLANILGGYGLNEAVQKLFAHSAPDLDTAYSDPSLLVQYGLKDALFTLLIRQYIMNGEFPKKSFDFEVKRVIKKENRGLFNDRIQFSIIKEGGLIDG